MAAVRRGLGQMVPLTALAIYTAEEIDRLVCGQTDWKYAPHAKAFHADLAAQLTTDELGSRIMMACRPTTHSRPHPHLMSSPSPPPRRQGGRAEALGVGLGERANGGLAVGQHGQMAVLVAPYLATTGSPGCIWRLEAALRTRE